MNSVYHISKNLQVELFKLSKFIYADSASFINMLISIDVTIPLPFQDTLYHNRKLRI